MLEHYHYTLSGQTERAALILDASESAWDQRERQLEFCRSILPQLPADLNLEIYFLGNPNPYETRDLLTDGAQCFEENRRRCSLVNPVLSSLDPANFSAVMVMGSGTVFDLYDWLDTPWKQKLAPVSLGESLQSGKELPELHNPDTALLRGHLHTPLKSVQITGPGFLPLEWNSKTYQREYRQIPDTAGGSFLLCADNPPALEMRLLLCKGQALTLTREYTGGRISRITAVPEPMPMPEPEPAGRLSEKESACFRLASQGMDYTCPRCGKFHAPKTLHCPAAESILPPFIYPCLEKCRGIVRVCPDADGFVYYLHGDVLAAENNRVLLYTGRGRAAYMRYSSGGWIGETPLPDSYEKWENCHVLFL